MLGRRDDPRALEGRHECRTHAGGEVGILAVGLLHATPAHVAGQVHHRREHLPDAPASGFVRDRPRDPRQEQRVPGGREADGLGKHGRAGAHQAVQGLFERDDWNAQPGLLDEVALDRVDPLGLHAGPGAAGDLQAEHTVGPVAGRVLQVTGEHEQLPELLFERHPAQQVLHPSSDRQGDVPVGDRRRALRGGRAGEAEYRSRQQRGKQWSHARGDQKRRKTVSARAALPAIAFSSGG